MQNKAWEYLSFDFVCLAFSHLAEKFGSNLLRSGVWMFPWGNYNVAGIKGWGWGAWGEFSLWTHQHQPQNFPEIINIKDKYKHKHKH